MPKYLAKYYRNVFLAGLPGTGKSLLGKSYAHFSGRDFLDFDVYLELSLGKTIAQIFEREGEAAFREHEARIMQTLEKKQHLVVSLGGGTLTRDENFAFAKNIGLIVALECPLDLLAQRIFCEREKRPLFSALDSAEQVLERLKQLKEEREGTFNQCDLFLQTGFSSIDNLKLELGLKEKKKYHEEKRKIRQKEASEDSGLDVTLPLRLDTKTPRLQGRFEPVRSPAVSFGAGANAGKGQRQG